MVSVCDYLKSYSTVNIKINVTQQLQLGIFLVPLSQGKPQWAKK